MAVPKKGRITAKKAGSNIPAIPESNGSAVPVGNIPSNVTLPEDFAEQVRRRAYEIYEQSGRPDGRAQEHWAQAEAEIRSRKSA